MTRRKGQLVFTHVPCPLTTAQIGGVELSSVGRRPRALSLVLCAPRAAVRGFAHAPAPPRPSSCAGPVCAPKVAVAPACQQRGAGPIKGRVEWSEVALRFTRNTSQKGALATAVVSVRSGPSPRWGTRRGRPAWPLPFPVALAAPARAIGQEKRVGGQQMARKK